MSKKTYLTASVVIALVLVLSPISAFAAFDDVTLTTDVVITVGGINLNVSGSSAIIESITVNANNFSVDMESGASITVSSSDRRALDTDSADPSFFSSTCTATESTLTLSETGATTITVTPSSDICDNTSSDGGGGGGGGSSTTPAPPTAQVALPPTAAPQATTAISAVFTRALARGSTGNDVQRLQQLLNTDPATQVAVSGVGSPGNETTFFGSLTQQAVQKFQAKYGIVSSGMPGTTGYGRVGPKTRAKLAGVFGETAQVALPSTAAPAATTAISSAFTRALARGSTGNDVQRLQQLLNSDTDTKVAGSGAGSSGSETTFFGSLTEQAVQKFQIKHGVVTDSTDPGYGYVGPKTRGKLAELFGI